MKIGYINIRSPNPDKGTTGRTVHLQEVCKAWRKMGHEVFVITGNHLNIAADVKTHNLSVPTPLSFDRCRQKIISILLSIYNMIKGKKIVTPNQGKEKTFPASSVLYDTKKISWSPRNLCRDLIQIINEYQYDKFVYIHSKKIIENEKPNFLYQRLIFGESIGLKLSKEYRIPLILEINASSTFKSEWTMQHTKFYDLIKRAMENKLCRYADAILVVTQTIKNYFVKQDISANKIFVNPNGVDLDRYYPDDIIRQKIRTQYGLDNKIVIGFLGNFRPWHDVFTLIQSAEIVLNIKHDVHFILIGDGPSKNQVESMVREKNIGKYVTFIGSIPNEKVPGHIDSMDIAVAPISKVPYFHGSPIKIFEYQSICKPVIVSRYPDIQSIIDDHKGGILVEPGDKVQLADAILELANNRELRKQLGRKGRLSVEKKYTWERNANKILDIYHHVKQSRFY